MYIRRWRESQCAKGQLHECACTAHRHLSMTQIKTLLLRASGSESWLSFRKFRKIEHAELQRSWYKVRTPGEVKHLISPKCQTTRFCFGFPMELEQSCHNT
ncbi:hypothetical protein HYE67_002420 [Fusarium culmorum]|uniref:Uncharacterized protein n=1 Tax=Fusarium culmorum TaxID=5516 RepID=A0A2T4GUS2_FUSCU|nr:hypothetical protein FCULG_00006647 [Fusarium culmorum]QPC60189.1 hypothetical protein HYE67_002420 [Fusarium culmorum]